MPQISSILEDQKEQEPHDLEASRVQSAHLDNGTVSSFSWKALNATVKDHKTKSTVTILDNCSGIMRAGEMLAIMGPSGSGKTTLLNALAHRTVAAGATTSGSILVNGQDTTLQMVRDLSSYVEQEDALIGSLTVKETMAFAARLSLPSKIDKTEARRRVDDLIASFGLQSRADTIVGTPIKKGLSGGQKKRLSIASKLVTNPRILFLDEPTSGLDSALSLEVCSYIKAIAKKHNVRFQIPVPHHRLLL
jgi:ABC-type multidrug transport system ATPase subunit